jgi:hypothetical protein
MTRLTCLCNQDNHADGKYGSWSVDCQKCGLHNGYSNDYGYYYTRTVGKYQLHHDEWNTAPVYVCNTDDIDRDGRYNRYHFSDDLSILTRTDLTEQKIKTMILLK